MDDDELAERGNCTNYLGTDYIEGKIWLVGVFGTSLAMISILLNSFLCIVYVHSPSLRRSAVLYFGVIAIVDTIMGFNYIAAMSVQVIFDHYRILWLYHLFLSFVKYIMFESNAAIFASSLLILLATTERLLRTFQIKTSTELRSSPPQKDDEPQLSLSSRFVEKNRLLLCGSCILIAVAYKISILFEIDVKENANCPIDEFSRFELDASPFVKEHDVYRFLWMFLARFVVDKLVPFILLVFMNFKIIKALKQQTFEPKRALFATSKSTKSNRRNIRDATRTLIIMVSMYIVSQTPQVVLAILETIPTTHDALNSDAFHMAYSYANDVTSICTLLSSGLRFPVYLAHNRQINDAAGETLKDLIAKLHCGETRKPVHYEPIEAPCLTSGYEAAPVTTKVLSDGSVQCKDRRSSNEYSALQEYTLNEYHL